MLPEVADSFEEGGASGNRVDTLARVAIALGRYLVISFPKTCRPSSRTPSKSHDILERDVKRGVRRVSIVSEYGVGIRLWPARPIKASPLRKK